MCGIVGIVSLDGRESVDPARVRRMRDTLRHRGPDGQGIFVEGPAGLGHRRLAIVDVQGGVQPMCNEDGTIWITFNGEIYNHADLRPGLEARGHVYRTKSDTETILHLYEAEGDACVERLQGMFAFAIWDRTRRRLLLARDRLGIKPLYLAWTGKELLFASEIKALLASGRLKPAFNPGVLPEFLATRFVSKDETFFEGISQLGPGRTLTFSPGAPAAERRYWRLPAVAEIPSASVSSEAAGVRFRLREAVRSHLMSDVPLGLFLSGGLDSSGLLALMSPLASERVRTFSVGFDEAGANELAYARLAAETFRADHREVVVSPADFFDVLPRLVWHEDAPIAFPSSVPLYFVSRLARDHVKVVLTGEGADELFLGYNRYRVAAWNERLGRPYWSLVSPRARKRVGAWVRRLPPGLRRYAERSFLALEPGPRSLFFENFAVFSRPLRERVVADRESAAQDPYDLDLYHEAPGGSLERMCFFDLQTYLARLLMKQDQMSMAASVESRVPFLDHAFVEYAAALPGRLKLRGLTTKAVLRAALEPLVPRAILTRRKMGFPVPVGAWLRGPFYSIVEEFVLGQRARERGFFEATAVAALCEEHRSGRADHGDRLWLLANLEIWHRVCVDGEDASAVMRAA